MERRRRNAGRRDTTLVLLALVPLVLTACVRPEPPPPPSPPPPTVIVYGDSLTAAAQTQITSGIQVQRPGWRVVVNSLAGTALCDWLGHMQDDGNLNARAVVIQFSGNAFTPCMAGIVANTPAWLAKYRADADLAASIWTSRGVRVALVGSPRSYVEPPPLLAAPHPLDAVYEAVAATWAPSGATFSTAPEMSLAVPDLADPSHFVFPLRMPCLPSELAVPACVIDLTDGVPRIQVRDGAAPNAGDPANRGHFCPVQPTADGVCPVYSSGSVRFGGAMAAVALSITT